MSSKYFVEFLGTMFLTFVIFATGNWAAIGAALAIGVLLGGAVSGGAFNPAVALALYSAGKLPKADLIPYIIVWTISIVVAICILYMSRDKLQAYWETFFFCAFIAIGQFVKKCLTIGTVHDHFFQ